MECLRDPADLSPIPTREIDFFDHGSIVQWVVVHGNLWACSCVADETRVLFLFLILQTQWKGNHFHFKLAASPVALKYWKRWVRKENRINFQLSMKRNLKKEGIRAINYLVDLPRIE